jgi:hypothetical protein
VPGGTDKARRPRAGAAINAGAAFVLVLLIALVAISQTQSPPPAIAEISPEALKTIQQAPNNQSSRFGSAEGGGVNDEAGPPDTVKPPKTVVVPRTRKCVGNPPRQIEDPQSPPCVPFFAGDNGGATWKGVTRDTINVVIPNYDSGNVGLTALYEAFFNHRFEFYGRKMKIIDGTAVSLGSPATDESGAATFDEQYHAFAVGAGPPDDYYFYKAAARRGMVAENTEIIYTDAELNQLHNVYQYFMGVDTVFANQGNWACSRLAGGNAVHAGPLLQGDKRKFGIIMTTAWQDNPASPKPLEDELAKCGEKAKTLKYTFNASSFPTPQMKPGDATNAIIQMKREGVTSLFFLGDPPDMNVVMNAATSQGYFPEWLIGSYVDIDNNLLMHADVTDPNQLAHTFGLTFQPRVTRPEAMPAAWAAWEEDPGYKFNAGDQLAFAAKQYWAIFEIAAGIQMAGPKLTPATFEAGLRKAIFPNPITKIMIGAAGFNDPIGGHSMTKDGAEIYWDPSATDGAGGAGSGAWCYVDNGKRHRLGGWPKGGDPFFQAPCDTGAQINYGPTTQ